MPTRLENLEAVTAEEERLALDEEMQATKKRIRSNRCIYKPFPVIPQATAWLHSFCADALRYPILIILAQSFSGKTEYAKSLFRSPLELQIGDLCHFPDKLRTFDRAVHDGIVLDDIRDLSFLCNVQDKLQGKYDALLEFASTLGGQCKYFKYLFLIPIVATANYSTCNLQFLETHDWLGKESNRTIIHLPSLSHN